MRWKTKDPQGRFRLRESIDIDREVETVFAHWNRFEDFPRFMECVRRTKRIGEGRVLWDIDIAGRQIVWEAHIVESIPEKLVRWESRWGARNSGEARFEPLSDRRTRLTLSIEFRPQRILWRLGARFGLPDYQARRDLERFARFVERARLEEPHS